MPDKERERNTIFGTRKEGAKAREGDIFKKLASNSVSSQDLSDADSVLSPSPTPSVCSISSTRSTKKRSKFSR